MDPNSPKTAPPVPITVTPRAREIMKRFERETAAYRRELARLLEEGHAGRYALIKGDQLFSVWDTWGDANQAALERFGLDTPYFVKRIDPRDPERFALLDAWLAAQCPS